MCQEELLVPVGVELGLPVVLAGFTVNPPLSAVVVVLAAAENFFQAAPSHSTIVVCTAVPSSDHSDHNLLK